MAFYSENLALPNDAFQILRNLIMDKTGIYFEDSKKDLLADKLSDRVIELGMNSFIDYYYLLKYDREGAEEWNAVFDLITVNETYFWREFDHIDTLIQYILPEFERQNRGAALNIWCAACSTGEEPISIIMALDDSGWLNRIRVNMIANDASKLAISRAREGVYRERSVRHLPSYIRNRYFIHENNGWRVKPEIHQKINWGVMNLSDPKQMDQLPRQHIIFCRNVFIYFKEETIRKITEAFYSKLNSPGYLYIGVSESLFRIKSSFELAELGKTFVYKKN